eukprot:TRINITY_DN12568_c0_g2_i1.p1 TRINITY_DN12568_c0_g2~~TRINITY_DN12568_c0_g2_i1.p1  ORF type:complete len:615 (+),score=154.65 TRINITY_DN12568_c0_g2_i1:22-1845(+)
MAGGKGGGDVDIAGDATERLIHQRLQPIEEQLSRTLQLLQEKLLELEQRSDQMRQDGREVRKGQDEEMRVREEMEELEAERMRQEGQLHQVRRQRMSQLQPHQAALVTLIKSRWKTEKAKMDVDMLRQEKQAQEQATRQRRGEEGNAVTLIQSKIKANQASVVLERLQLEWSIEEQRRGEQQAQEAAIRQRQREEAKALSLIQSKCKTYQASVEVERLRQAQEKEKREQRAQEQAIRQRQREETTAISFIQSKFKSYQASVEVERLREAWEKVIRAEKERREQYEQEQAARQRQRKEHSAVALLQSRFKSYQARAELDRLREAREKLKREEQQRREQQAREQALRQQQRDQVKAIALIQSMQKTNLARVEIMRLRQMREEAAREELLRQEQQGREQAIRERRREETRALLLVQSRWKTFQAIADVERLQQVRDEVAREERLKREQFAREQAIRQRQRQEVEAIVCVKSRWKSFEARAAVERMRREQSDDVEKQRKDAALAAARTGLLGEQQGVTIDPQIAAKLQAVDGLDDLLLELEGGVVGAADDVTSPALPSKRQEDAVIVSTEVAGTVGAIDPEVAARLQAVDGLEDLLLELEAGDADKEEGDA